MKNDVVCGYHRFVFCTFGCMFSIISAWLWHVTIYKEYYVVVRIITGFLATISSVCSMAGFYVLTFRFPKYASTFNIVMLYLIGSQPMKWLTALKYKRFLQSTNDICRIQEEFLLTRLKKHENTEYGIRYRFKEISSVADYRSRHPLTNYNHYREYIQREADGETGVLLTKKPVQIALSSGTTGKAKMILMSNEQRQCRNSGDLPTVIDTILNNLAKLNGIHRRLQKRCILFVDPSTTFSKSGILISSVTKHIGRNHTQIKIISNTPVAGFRISAEKSAYYVHALFSLRDRNTGLVNGYFSSVVYGFLRLIEDKWMNLVDDIERGTLNADLDFPAGIRHELEKQLVPDPKRASELKREFQRGFEGIVNRVWPFLTGIMTITSGSFSVYANILRERYCKGTILYSYIFACSEGMLGTSMWPDDPKLRDSYILLPNAAFFEFINMNLSKEDQPTTSLLHELKIGESYEMVITNLSGLYRYRLGDVMKVVGYVNKSPIVEFQYRIGEVLNIKGEMTSEDCIVSALSNTLNTWGDTELEEYACAENTMVDAVEKTTSDLPHYIIFVQLRGFVMSDRREEQMKQLDEELCNTATAYRFQRNKGAIGPLRLVTVRTGSFAELREFIMRNSTASSNQFKIPRKLRKREWVEFMLERTEK